MRLTATRDHHEQAEPEPEPELDDEEQEEEGMAEMPTFARTGKLGRGRVIVQESVAPGAAQ